MQCEAHYHYFNRDTLNSGQIEALVIIYVPCLKSNTPADNKGASRLYEYVSCSAAEAI